MKDAGKDPETLSTNASHEGSFKKVPDSPGGMKCYVVAALLAVYFVYIVLGGAVLMALENTNEITTKQSNSQFKLNWLANHSCVNLEELDALIKTVRSSQSSIPTGNVTNVTHTNEIWNIHTSIYFATTVVTTIGYGNIAPITPGGRVFCVFFGLIGIPFALVVFAQIGIKLSNLLKRLGDLLEHVIPCGVNSKHPKVMKTIRYLMLQSVMFVVLMLLPSLVFIHMQLSWSYEEALYYSFVTLTTIGFGDYVAGFGNIGYNEAYRILVAFWIVLGLAWMSSFIATAQGLFDTSIARVEEKAKEIEDKLEEKRMSVFGIDFGDNSSQGSQDNEKEKAAKI